MSEHQIFIALANRLIDKHGRDISFNILNSVPTDPSKPWKGNSTSPQVLGPFKCVFLPFRGFEFGSLFEDFNLMKDCNEICMCAGSQADLELAHELLDNSKPFKIEWVQRLRPGSQTVLYAFGVNR